MIQNIPVHRIVKDTKFYVTSMEVFYDLSNRNNKIQGHTAFSNNKAEDYNPLVTGIINHNTQQHYDHKGVFSNSHVTLMTRNSFELVCPVTQSCIRQLF